MNIGRVIRESAIRKIRVGGTGNRTPREQGKPVPAIVGGSDGGGITGYFDPNNDTAARRFTIGRSAIGGPDQIA